MQADLEVGVEPPGGEGAQVQRGATDSADVRDARQQLRGDRALPGSQRHVVAEPGADDGALEGDVARPREPLGTAGNAPAPRLARNNSPETGLATAPATTTPSTSAATETAYCGIPRTKLTVPSIGSISHRTPERADAAGTLLAQDRVVRARAR